MARGGAGKYRHRIQIATREEATKGTYGGATTRYVYQASRWALVTNVSGREAERADKQEAIYNYNVKCRVHGNEEIKPTSFIKWSNTKLKIISAIPDPKRREWLIKCAAIADDGGH